MTMWTLFWITAIMAGWVVARIEQNGYPINGNTFVRFFGVWIIGSFWYTVFTLFAFLLLIVFVNDTWGFLCLLAGMILAVILLLLLFFVISLISSCIVKSWERLFAKPLKWIGTLLMRKN